MACKHPSLTRARHAFYDAVETTINKLLRKVDKTDKPDAAMQFKTELNTKLHDSELARK